MNFLDKVKNFFLEEEEVDVPEKKQVSKKIEKKIAYDEEESKKNNKNETDLSEKELFNVSKTFNFPMDLDENIFDKEDIKKETPRNIYATSVSKKKESTMPIKKEVKTETKKFKPTPIVSPVYGILNKDYQVSDVESLSKTKEFNFDKKTVDFDSVRNKAYKELDDEIEKTFTKNRDIFYNLEDENNVDDNLEEENETHLIDDVIITYNTDDNQKDDKEMLEEDISRSKKNKIKEETDEKEEDLFNLIDNMYKSEEDNEEEDE